MRVADFIDGLECKLDPVVESDCTLDLRRRALAERDGRRGDEGSLSLCEHAMGDVSSGREDYEGREGEWGGDCDHGGVLEVS